MDNELTLSHPHIEGLDENSKYVFQIRTSVDSFLESL